MKKFIFRLMVCTLVVTALCTTLVFAQSPVTVTRDGDAVNVAASTLDPNEETTILVVDKGVGISGAFADTETIHHIDQVAASSAGVATFDFKYSGTAALDIYVGYATMSATDVPFEAVVDEIESGGDTPPAGQFVYGDVNNDESIDLADASDVINYFLHGTLFTDSASAEEEVYEYGEAAADVNADESIDLADASDIINYFLHGNEFEANQQ